MGKRKIKIFNWDSPTGIILVLLARTGMEIFLAIAIIAMLLVSPANGAKKQAPFNWRNSGAAPFAHSRGKAMTGREAIFRALGYPDELVKKLVEATEKPGRPALLPDHLDWMVSRGGIIHRNVVVLIPPNRRGAEMWQVEGTKIFLPICYNWSGARGVKKPAIVAPPAPSPPVYTTKGCPGGIAIFANAWTWESLPPDLQEKVNKLIAAAERRDSENATNPNPYKAQSVSNSLGDEIIRRVGVRAPLTGVEISAEVVNPKTLQVEKKLGNFKWVNGIAPIPLIADQRTRAIEFIFPSWFRSPTISGGKRRLIVFPKAWDKKGGGRYCTLQVNGIYRKTDKP